MTELDLSNERKNDGSKHRNSINQGGRMMTPKQLIKKLNILDKKYPRSTVVVDWDSFASDEHTHGPVIRVSPDNIQWSVDDNAILADGNERRKDVIVLSGR